MCDRGAGRCAFEQMSGSDACIEPALSIVTTGITESKYTHLAHHHKGDH